ncbi:L-histidine N(alpha)-methyltransferase [Pedobacter arcticus]|uniref:L-histidine N(alpha)-methyltransferase n=1 Tax=Pedobacter arcticus TaxID=752140 RepID=UPI00031AF4C7|nr:L-histidine N(alpha)-methyltransferase [Pedobacter arcticus]
MLKTFEQDVIVGLTSAEKFLPSKYFYNDEGSRIFKEIMEMPSYYLSNCEYEILALQAAGIHDKLGFDEPFNIIELGAGDGTKTFKLLQYLLTQKVSFDYIPIDISQEAMNMLSETLHLKLPELSIKPAIGDYFEVLDQLKHTNKQQSLLLFLGSNIGNYPNKEAIELMQLLNKCMKKGDKLLMGIDLQKNPKVIYDAYSDSGGITKRFNLNLLKRINRELGANFDIDQFDFYCYYNPRNGELFSYLVSLAEQEVFLPNTNTKLFFRKDEIIWTEQSKKYNFKEIELLAEQSGFSVVNCFIDSKRYFTDSLLSK